MGDKETLLGLATFAGANLIENLKFIPEDKFTWKPAPHAKSVQEMMNHLLENLTMFNGHFGGEKSSEVQSIDEAKSALRSSVEQFVNNVRNASPEKLAQVVDAGAMQMPLGTIVNIGVVELLHHHGQIAYIQSLLGDEESHFDMQAFGKML